jgi:hypothetical protein
MDYAILLAENRVSMLATLPDSCSVLTSHVSSELSLAALFPPRVPSQVRKQRDDVVFILISSVKERRYDR